MRKSSGMHWRGVVGGDYGLNGIKSESGKIGSHTYIIVDVVVP